MTHESRYFQRSLLGSLALHAVLLTLFFTLPGGGPAEPVQIYTVRILEAPAQPEARALELSTAAISALRLESPSLSADAPPLPQPEQDEVPDVERFAPAIAPPTVAPPPAPSRAPALTLPQSAPAAPAVAPNAPETPAAPTTPPARQPLPQLPGLPAPPRAIRPPASPPPTVRPGARLPAPPQLRDDEPARPSAMERLRTRVRTLDLQVEAAPPQQSRTAPTPTREQNVLSLRVYSNRVREAVKEQYAFPGGFDPNLRTRVRVVLNRDGSVRSTELLESSGNERFDRLVCMAAIGKAEIPPVPAAVDGEGDTLTLLFTCSP